MFQLIYIQSIRLFLIITIVLSGTPSFGSESTAFDILLYNTTPRPHSGVDRIFNFIKASESLESEKLDTAVVVGKLKPNGSLSENQSDHLTRILRSINELEDKPRVLFVDSMEADRALQAYGKNRAHLPSYSGIKDFVEKTFQHLLTERKDLFGFSIVLGGGLTAIWFVGMEKESLSSLILASVYAIISAFLFVARPANWAKFKNLGADATERGLYRYKNLKKRARLTFEEREIATFAGQASMNYFNLVYFYSFQVFFFSMTEALNSLGPIIWKVLTDAFNNLTASVLTNVAITKARRSQKGPFSDYAMDTIYFITALITTVSGVLIGLGRMPSEYFYILTGIGGTSFILLHFSRKNREQVNPATTLIEHFGPPKMKFLKVKLDHLSKTERPHCYSFL